MKQNDSQAIVRRTLQAAAPERAHDWDGIWRDLNPLFQVIPDQDKSERIILDAGAYRVVRFNHRVMRAFWIAGYAAWEGYRVIAASTPEGSVDLARFRELLAAFERTIESDDLDVEPLPAGVCEPGRYADTMSDAEGRAAGELATIGVAWALLHELRHVRHQQEGTGSGGQRDSAKENHDEELSCDAAAAEFLLQEMEAYTAQTGADLEAVRDKRQAGIFFGLFAVTLLAKDKWGASATHPALKVRLEEIQASMTPASRKAQMIAYGAFAALGMVWPDAPRFRAVGW